MKFLLIVLLLSLLLYGCSQQSQRATDITTTDPEDTEPPVRPFFSLENTVFLGDSNTAHLSNYGLVDDSNIWTGSERYLTLEPDICRKCIVYPDTGEELTVADAARLKKPDFMVITLGTDGAMSLDKEGFRLSYISLIESIRAASPNTEIILQSIFPVRMGEVNIRFNDPSSANKCFEQSNMFISEIADEYGLIYIDTYSIMTDSDGMLRTEYNTDHLDGYHLNRAGLSAMLDFICSQMEKK